MRIAVIDVGSNTTRLYVAQLRDGAIGEESLRLSRVTRLGAGVDASGRLAPDALRREFTVLEEYRELLSEHDVQRTVAVMTSAVRDAANGERFAQDVRALGFEARILSGEEEARLTYLGATSGHAAEQQPLTTLVCDIGGGSTELVIGHGEQLDFHVSTQVGVVRQADRHVSHDPPSARELEAISQDVRATFAAAVPQRWREGVGRAIGVAGTPTQLAALAQRLVPYDPARVHGYRLQASTRDAIFAQLRTMDHAQRQRVPGMHPDRADVILPGMVILEAVMELFGLQEIEVSEHDILRGAALAYGHG